MRDRAAANHVVKELSKVLFEAIDETQQYEQELPHILVCIDHSTGAVTYSGPFRSRDEAQQMATREAAAVGVVTPLAYETAPLYPPHDLASPGTSPP